MTTFGFGLLLLLLYTYAGYPLLVALLSRLVPRQVWISADYEPTVSVCMTVHNGAQHLQSKLETLEHLHYPREKIEVLIYSDGSTDDTEQMAMAAALRDPRVRVLSNAQRLGKPAGLNQLRLAAQGEVLLMTDVRQALAPHALRDLLTPLSDPAIGCVSGSLVLFGTTGAGAYWHYERFIRGAEARLGNMVGVSGSLYVLRREDLDELPCDVLLDDMFVPLGIARRRKRVVLSHTAEAYDHSYDDEQEFGRKVRTLAGNYQLISKLPWLLVPWVNPLWFQLVSHKLLRLVCPWALLGLLGSSLLLSLSPELGQTELWFWRALLVGQLASYLLAALGARAGRLAALSRTFVVLNAAAVVGLWRFLRGSQAVTW